MCSICYEICNKWREFQEKCKHNEEFLNNLNLNDEESEIKTEIEHLDLEVPEECNSDQDLNLKSTILNTVCEVKIDEDIEEQKEQTNLRANKIVFKSIRREVNQYSCKECGEGFKTESQLRKHTKGHIPDSQHVCKECGKGFKTEFKLKSHAKVHITYSCDKCVNSRVFTDKRSFQVG